METPFWTIDTLFYTRIADAYIPKYIYYLFCTIDWSRMNEASGVPSLSAKTIENLEVCVVERKKQEMIVAALSSIDTQISVTKNLLSKYKSIKKATVNLLLRPKYDWTVKPLGDLAFIKTGSKNTQDAIPSGKYPFFVRSPKVERINSYSYDGEAVLVAGDGVGAGKVFHYVNGKHDCHQRVYRLRDFSSEIYGRYIYYVLSSQFPSYMEQQNDKASVDSLRLPAFKKFPVFYPKLSEQHKIVSAIDCVTHTINKFQSELSKCQNVKQSMLQYFFG